MKRKRFGPKPKRKNTKRQNPSKKKRQAQYAREYEKDRDERRGLPCTVLDDRVIEAIAFGVRQGMPDQLVSDSLIIPGPLFTEWKARGIRYIQALQNDSESDKPIADDRLCGKLVFSIRKAHSEFISMVNKNCLLEKSTLWKRDQFYLQARTLHWRVDNIDALVDSDTLPDETFL